MVGGGLIVVALLLICGPLEGQFGERSRAVDVAEEIPAVSAAPIVPLETAQAETVIVPPVVAAVPAIDSALKDTGSASSTDSVDTAPAVVVAPVPVKSAPSDVADTASSSLPVVSAPGPTVIAPIVSPLVPALSNADRSAADAASEFDSSLADAGDVLDSSLGNVVDRFAPPVDSGPVVVMAAQAFNSFALRPCDSPGAGCQKVNPRRRARPTPASGGGGRGPRGTP